MKKGSPIALELKKFRIENSLTQKGLASLLGISQEHISRVERGALEPSQALLDNIRKVISSKSSFKKGTYQSLKFNRLKITSFVYPDQKTSGDRIFVFDDKKGKTILIHYDITGSGEIAKNDADKLYWLVRAVSLILEGAFLTVESIYFQLDRIVRTTKEEWVGFPGCSIFLFNHSSDQVSFLNAGMPPVYKLSLEHEKIEIIKTQNPTIGSYISGQKIYIENFRLEKTGFLFLTSDGFKEFFSTITSVPLESVLESFGRAFSNDIEPISEKIIKTFEGKTNPGDDLSFAGIGYIGN